MRNEKKYEGNEDNDKVEGVKLSSHSGVNNGSLSKAHRADAKAKDDLGQMIIGILDSSSRVDKV